MICIWRGVYIASGSCWKWRLRSVSLLTLLHKRLMSWNFPRLSLSLISSHLIQNRVKFKDRRFLRIKVDLSFFLHLVSFNWILVWNNRRFCWHEIWGRVSREESFCMSIHRALLIPALIWLNNIFKVSCLFLLLSLGKRMSRSWADSELRLWIWVILNDKFWCPLSLLSSRSRITSLLVTSNIKLRLKLWRFCVSIVVR